MAAGSTRSFVVLLPSAVGGSSSPWLYRNHTHVQSAFREGSMIKNTADQRVGVQMVSATDGSAFTGAVTVSVTLDAGVQATGSVGAGACTHEGNGYHTYAPAQAETNGDLAAFTFTGSGAVPQTVQAWTRAATPDVNVSTITANAITAASIAADAITDAKVAADVTIASVTGAVGSVTGAVGSVTGAVGSVTGAVGSVTGNVGGNVTGSVGSVAAGGITAASIAADAITAAKVAPDVHAEAADAVWDEVLTGATHNVVNSSGRRLRGVAAALGGTINDAGATTTSFITTITGYNDNHFNDQLVNFIDGAASGEVGVIVDYDGATGTITLEEPLTAAPGNGSAFEIIATHVHPKSQIAAAIWDKVQADHVIAGSFGLIATEVADILVDTAVIGAAGAGLTAVATAAELAKVPKSDGTATWNATALASINTQADLALTDYDPPTKAEMDTGLDAVPTAAENADAILNRTISGGADGGRDVTSALRALRNRTAIAAGTLTVYAEDDTTADWTAAVTTAAGNPISEVDPA